MPYTQEHKSETRRKIVASARRLFNHRGFTDVTIDEIMAAAGLTRGGFYNHFDTKDELYAEAVRHVLTCDPAEISETGPLDRGADPGQRGRWIIDAYLSRTHLANLDRHCPLIALPSDVARAPTGVRRAFEDVLKSMISILEASPGDNGHGVHGHTPSDRKKSQREAALAAAALCVGGMVLARTLDEPALSEEVRAAAHDWALRIGGWV